MVAARRLADAIAKLADGDEAMRGARAGGDDRCRCSTALDELRGYLQAQPVTLETLPPEIASGWITKDGRAQIEVLPKGDPNDNEMLRKFAARGAGGRAERHRRADLDPGVGPHHDQCVHRGRHLGARLDRASCCGSCCAASATCC